MTMIEKRGPVVIAGNWKMNHGIEETAEYLRELKELLSAGTTIRGALTKGSVEMIIFPPSVALHTAYIKTEAMTVTIGIQHIHWEYKGAFTGELSVPMAKEAGCSFALVGHSERRHLFGETIEMTARKLSACMKGDITPVLCIGETREERSAGHTEQVLSRQFDGAFKDIPVNGEEMIYIAYEPVWAIGTGDTATPDDAETACGFIRKRITARFGPKTSQKARILYGGSVKPQNARELLSQENVDGVLVGGASLDPGSFLEIAKAALP